MVDANAHLTGYMSDNDNLAGTLFKALLRRNDLHIVNPTNAATYMNNTANTGEREVSLIDYIAVSSTLL